MIKKYRSIPFEAFLLADDMSNWKEGCVFLGDSSDYSSPEFDEPPEFLDVPTEDGYEYGTPNNFICKDANGYYEVWSYDYFIKTFEEVVD